MADSSKPLDTEEARRICPPKYEFADAEEGYEYTLSRECNAMTFTDDTGTQYYIYLPPGTLRKACDHCVHKRWEELRKFPKFEGQKHTDDDDVITKWKKNPTTKEEEEGVVVKRADDPLIRTADGKIVLYPNKESRAKE